MSRRPSFVVDAVVRLAKCPKCGAEEGKRCRTLTTGRSTDTHEARREAYWSPEERAKRLADGPW